MKFIFILLGIVLLIFIVIQVFAMSGQKNIEMYPYVVNEKYDTFEVRSYEASLFTSVKLSMKEYKKASSKGFSILAEYIFGGNDKNEKIAMTSPVAMSLEDSMTVMFMVPKKFNKETLPQPNQSKIEFREEPAKTVAAITFGGWADDEKIKKYKEKLKAALDAEGIEYTNRFYFLGYNPPYEVFNRKNEVIVELEKKSASHFSSFDKTKIAFTDEGNGEAVMLLHGFIVNGSTWNKTVLKKSLLDKGYRVIIPDLRGNGNSDKPQNEEAYMNDAEIKDLMALADHLQLTTYKAVGYSRGSIVLAKLLTKEKRISKAVLGGMGLDFTNPDWDRRIAFADAFSGRAQPSELTEGAITYAKSIDADLKVLGFLQDHQPVTSVEELQNITIETLVISGDLDTDNGNPKSLQKQLPNSSIVIVEGDHNNTLKQENFAEAVMRFLPEL